MTVYILPFSICSGPILVKPMSITIRIGKVVQVHIITLMTVRFQPYESFRYDYGPTFDSGIQKPRADLDDVFKLIRVLLINDCIVFIHIVRLSPQPFLSIFFGTSTALSRLV